MVSGSASCALRLAPPPCWLPAARRSDLERGFGVTVVHRAVELPPPLRRAAGHRCPSSCRRQPLPPSSSPRRPSSSRRYPSARRRASSCRRHPSPSSHAELPTAAVELPPPARARRRHRPSSCRAPLPSSRRRPLPSSCRRPPPVELPPPPSRRRCPSRRRHVELAAAPELDVVELPPPPPVELPPTAVPSSSPLATAESPPPPRRRSDGVDVRASRALATPPRSALAEPSPISWLPTSGIASTANAATASQAARAAAARSAAAGRRRPSAIAADRQESHQPTWWSVSGVHCPSDERAADTARSRGAGAGRALRVARSALAIARRSRAAPKTHSRLSAASTLDARVLACFVAGSCAAPGARRGGDRCQASRMPTLDLRNITRSVLRRHHPPGFAGLATRVDARMPR